MIDSTRFITRAQERARLNFQQPLQTLGYWQLHQVLGEALMEEIAPAWQATSQSRQQGKQRQAVLSAG